MSSLQKQNSKMHLNINAMKNIKKNIPLSIINKKPVILFIPRLLPNVSKEFITDYFMDNKIGIVIDINAKYRVNEKNNRYWFAFISVQFLDTPYGRDTYTDIVKKEKTIFMTYNKTENKYWEISIRDRDRQNVLNKENNPITPPILVNANQPLVNVNQPLVNVNQPLVNANQPLVNANQPLVNVNQPLVNVNQPLVNVNQPLVKSKKILEDGEVDEENILTTSFTFYDHVEIYRDFIALEKDIFGNNTCNSDFLKSSYPTWGKFVPLRI
jgi:hypothetical protein